MYTIKINKGTQSLTTNTIHPLMKNLKNQYPNKNQASIFKTPISEIQSNAMLNTCQTEAVKNTKKSAPMTTENPSNSLQKFAIIVPCYNEEKRFPYQEFLNFAVKHPHVLICFVNDGSKDNTVALLRGIQSESPINISVCSLKQNGGKSEAVRQGMLYMHRNFKADIVGFLDADLATTLEEWLQMAMYKEQYPQFGAIVGSRIQRLGANIKRNDSRSLFSSIVKKFIKVILKTPFQDSQCGAKIFQRNLVPFLFNKPFMTPWLFDVEIFLRLQKKFGKTTLQNGVLEFPLMHWTEVGDSRLKLKDTIKIPVQLLKLHFTYNVARKFKTKSGYSLFDSKINF